jgi:chromosome segregation ATPase
MVLGFCWVLLRHFRFGLDKDTSFEDALLKWVKEQLADYGDNEITNFKTSFCDGRALLALNHKWDNESVDYKNFNKSDPVKTISTALKLAEDNMKVPSLLDAKSLSQGDTKEKQVILYVSLLFNAFQAELEKRRLAGESQAKALSLREQLKLAQDENASMRDTLRSLQEKVDVLTKLLEQETKEKDALAALKEQLLKAKEQLEKETADLRAEKADLTNQINNARKERERLEAEFNEAQQKAAASMDPLLDTLARHLREMHEWKGFLAQGREYESENIQSIVEKEISEFSFDDQLVTLAEALSEENEKLKGFDRERKVYLNAVAKKKK